MWGLEPGLPGQPPRKQGTISRTGIVSNWGSVQASPDKQSFRITSKNSVIHCRKRDIDDVSISTTYYNNTITQHCRCRVVVRGRLCRELHTMLLETPSFRNWNNHICHHFIVGWLNSEPWVQMPVLAHQWGGIRYYYLDGGAARLYSKIYFQLLHIRTSLSYSSQFLWTRQLWVQCKLEIQTCCFTDLCHSLSMPNPSKRSPLPSSASLHPHPDPHPDLQAQPTPPYVLQMLYIFSVVSSV